MKVLVFLYKFKVLINTHTFSSIKMLDMNIKNNN